MLCQLSYTHQTDGGNLTDSKGRVKPIIVGSSWHSRADSRLCGSHANGRTLGTLLIFFSRFDAPPTAGGGIE